MRGLGDHHDARQRLEAREHRDQQCRSILLVALIDDHRIEGNPRDQRQRVSDAVRHLELVLAAGRLEHRLAFGGRCADIEHALRIGRA
ncbi:MAG: hypothetical protein HC855_03470 [Rhizobiales bacterium]|nr:hypothetical protein [Hyphomicrobiales bacterium]